MTAVHPKSEDSEQDGLVMQEVDDDIEGIDAPDAYQMEKPKITPVTDQQPPAYSDAGPSSQPPPPAAYSNPGHPSQPHPVTVQPINQSARALPQAFSHSMLDPLSMQVYQQCATTHKSHKRLTEAINNNAGVMYRDGLQHYNAHHDNLSYEQILATILFEGEQILLNSQYIYYNTVLFLDENGHGVTDKPAMTHGRAFLTTRRLLLLSAEDAIVSSLNVQTMKGQKPSTYHLSIKWGDSMYFQSLPIEGFRSIDLRCAVGVQSQSNVQGEKPPCSACCEGICCLFKPCCSCCEIESCMKKWSGDYPVTQSFNERYVTIGTLMPPWGRRMMVRIHFDSSMRLTFINSFLVEMQRHAPNLNKLDLAPVQFMPCQMAMHRQ